jgi:hypothetical protein
MNRSGLLILAATAAALFAAPAAFAQKAGQPMVEASASAFTPKLRQGVFRQQLGLVINEDPSANIDVPQGTFVFTDQQTKLRCDQSNGCTVIFRLWGQVHATDTADWGLCASVDGLDIKETCHYLGKTSATASSSGATFGTFQVAKGLHQVRTTVQIGVAGTMDAFHYEYELTTP